MKKSILSFAIFAITFNLNAQYVWQQVYNDLHSSIFTQTIDNEFVLAGAYYESMLTYWEIYKTDSVGNIKSGGLMDIDYYNAPRCIEATSDSGYIIAGIGDGYQNINFARFRRDSSCWELGIDQNENYFQEINSMAVGTNDDFVVTGRCSSNVFIMKISGEGDSLWSKKYFEETNSWGKSIVNSYDNGYYCLAGETDVGVILIEINSNGDTLWTKVIDNSSYPVQVCTTQDSCLLIAANKNNNTLVFIKTDKFGNQLWAKEYPNDNNNNNWNFCVSIANTFDNGLISANSAGPNGNPDNFWLLKLVENGDSSYSITPSLSKYFNLNPGKIMQTEDSLFVLIAFDNNDTPRLIKTDSTGNIITAISELVEPRINKLKCYPNPFENEINIEFENIQSQNTALNIYNLSGQIVFSVSSFTGSHLSFSLNDFKSGVYLVELIVGNEKYTSLIDKK